MKATPTAIKKLAGNPGKRPMNPREMKPPVGSPACPSWLTGDALDEWNRIVPALDALGVLTSVDSAVLIGHCVTLAEIAATVKSGGELKASLLGQLRGFAADLGLTPAARAKLAIAPMKQEDEFAQFFN